jgi:NarL family two-component system response regulator LiaR
MSMRVAIVDDYEVVVRGLVEMLRPYSEELVVVPLSSGAPVNQPVDIALYDPLAQGQRDGAGLAGLLADPAVRRVVVYSWSLERALVGETVDRGVAAFLSKTANAEALVSALRKVHAGERVSDVPAQNNHHAPADSRSWPGREHGLTAREAEVITLITQGLSNQEIADRASLSINSVKSYIRSSYRKMGVTSRTNAVLWGLDHGFSSNGRTTDAV